MRKNKKDKKQDINYLDLIPETNQSIRWHRDLKQRIILEIENKGMFNTIAHALLALAPEFDAVRVEDVPMSLKAWIDGSQGNIRRETLGAKCMVRHFFAN